MDKRGQHMLGRKLSQAIKKKMSLSHKGKIPKNINQIAGWNKDKKFSEETRHKMSKARIGKFCGKKSGNWKGGVSACPNYRRIYRKKRAEGSHTYSEWELLKIQYGYTCPCCKKSEPEIKLTEDHIIPLIKGGSDFIENIQPLCRYCNCKKFTKIIKY